MTTKRIVYQREDGGVTVLTPAESFRLKGESDNDFLLRVSLKDVPLESRSSARVIDVTDLPDRAKRKTWKLRNGKLEAE